MLNRTSLHCLITAYSLISGWIKLIISTREQNSGSILWHCFSSVQSLSRGRIFATWWTAPRQASLSITNSQSPTKPMSIESVMPSNHLILCRALLLPLSSFTSIKRLFRSFLPSAIRVVSSSYLVVAIYPSNLDSSLWVIQPSISYDESAVLCI